MKKKKRTVPAVEEPTPRELKRREKYMAVLAALGMEDDEIATELGVELRRVRRASKNPLFNAVVAGYQREFVKTGAKRGIDRLMHDTDKNVEFLTKTRDGHHFDADQPEALRFRLQAAAMLFDRQVPKKSESSSTQTKTIVIERDRRKEIELVMDEAKMPLRSPGVRRFLPAPNVKARPIDDVIAELEEQEGQ